MSFTIAHLSDPHLGPLPIPKLNEWTTKRFMGFVNWKRGRERLNDMAVLGRLVADMRAQLPDHVAMTGDAINIGLPAEFGPAAAWMRTLGPPDNVSFTPGNHDAYVRGSMPLLMSSFAPWIRSDDGVNAARPFPFLKIRGEVALIGLCSGVPTGPLMATGRLGNDQLERLASMLMELKESGLARIILIHHPPLATSARSMRSLTDARGFERVVGLHGAEAVLHGHNHARLLRFLPSPRAQSIDQRIPIIGVQSASSTSSDPRLRASYHLLHLKREGRHWTVSVRSRGLMRGSQQIGEQDPVLPPISG